MSKRKQPPKQPDAPRDPHDVLGVRRGASAEEIRDAYRKASMDNHPDRCPGDVDAKRRFDEATKAYEELNGKAGRRERDNVESRSVQALCELLVNVLTSGITIPPKHADLVGMMKRKVNEFQLQCRRDQHDLQQAKKPLEEIVDRFEVPDDDDNIFQTVIQSRLAAFDAQIAGLDEQIEITKVSLAYLGKCRFRFVPMPGSSGSKDFYDTLTRLMERSPSVVIEKP